jgi:hypothetical protein
MRKEYDLVPFVIDSLILAPNELNANTQLYMQISSQNLRALFSLLVKRTSSSCDVAGRHGKRTLPFLQHRINCGLLLFDFANLSLIHIFTLQNPQIVSISPQSHRVGVDGSLSPNNCNGPADFLRCLARRFFCWRLQHSRADFDVS